MERPPFSSDNESAKSRKSETPSPVGQLLSQHRRLRGLTQQTLADRSGVAVDTIGALESGKRQAPRPETLKLLVAALKLSPQEAALIRAAAQSSRSRPRRKTEKAQASADTPPAHVPEANVASPDLMPDSNTPDGEADTHDTHANAVHEDTKEASAFVSAFWVRPSARESRQERHRWPLHVAPPRPLATFTIVTVLLVALVVSTLLAVRTKAVSPTLPWNSAQVYGWLVYQQWATRQPNVLAAMNASTGKWRTLWPDARFLGQGASTDSAETFSSLHAPSYDISQHRLAFIAKDSDTVNSVWVATISHTSDGWPVVTPPGPVEVIADCGECAALSWSPDGAWLLYDTQSGLMAHSLTTGADRQITTGIGDHWPACSPDGQWLAFQQRSDTNGGIVVAPASDCLPVAQSTARHTRYLNGFTPSWRPAWSPDGSMLAFVALTVHGKWSAWIVRVRDLGETLVYGATTTAYQVSQPGCADPTWALRRPGTAGASSAIVYSCVTPTSDQFAGAVFATSGVPSAPTWQASLNTGIRAEQGGVWMPQ